MSPCQDISIDDMNTIERYIILLYDRTSSNENLPPTKDALIQHAKRAVYQAAGHIWGQSTLNFQVLPSYESWGWTRKGNEIKPLWITIPEASKACYLLIKCSCKKGCSARCNSRQHQLDCTELCQCSGQCSDD
eukprot:gene15999-7332_t